MVGIDSYRYQQAFVKSCFNENKKPRNLLASRGEGVKANHFYCGGAGGVGLGPLKSSP